LKQLVLIGKDFGSAWDQYLSWPLSRVYSDNFIYCIVLKDRVLRSYATKEVFFFLMEEILIKIFEIIGLQKPVYAPVPVRAR
jgi:hypothetical protein